MNKYEVIYIIDTQVEEAPRKELIEKFSQLIASNGGTVEKIDEWGKRRLAYTIDYKTEGYYVLLHMEAPESLPKELERNFQINENIIRYLVIKLEEKRSQVKPRPTPVRPVIPFQAQPVAHGTVPAGAAPIAPPAQEVAPKAPEAEVAAHAAEVEEAPAIVEVVEAQEAPAEAEAAPQAAPDAAEETTTQPEAE